MEEKITYTGVIFSASLLSFLHENILSSQLHKENKNYMKENKKSKLQLQISLNSTLCLVVLFFSFETAGIYKRNTEGREVWR